MEWIWYLNGSGKRDKQESHNLPRDKACHGLSLYFHPFPKKLQKKKKKNLIMKMNENVTVNHENNVE